MEFTHDILIDFSNPVRDNKFLTKNLISLPDKRKTALGFSKSPDIKKYHKLFIHDLELPEGLSVTDRERLVQLNINQAQKGKASEISGYEIKEFHVNQFEFPFDIELNASTIEDFHDLNTDRVTIRFSVSHQRKPADTPGLIAEYETSILFKKALSKPKLNFYLTEPEFEYGFEYKVLQKLHLGNLEIACESDVRYAEHIDQCLIKSRFQGIAGNSVYLTREPNEITESNPTTKGTPLKEEGERTVSDLVKELEGDAILLRQLLPGNKVTVPVYFDLDRYDSPLEEKYETVVTEMEFRKNGKSFTDSRNDQLIIKPDTRTTRLLSLLRYGTDQREIVSGDDFNLPRKYQWVAGTKGEKKCFTISLGNHAESNEGEVRINNLEFSFKVSADSGSTVVGKGTDALIEDPIGLGEDIGHIFQVRPRHNEEEVTLESEATFANGYKSFNDYMVVFRHDWITDIPNDVSLISCQISFDYQEFSEDVETGSGHYVTTIGFHVEKNPGSHWLTVDFGTSACVAAFSDGDNLGTDKILIDLQKSVEALVPSLYIEKEIEEYGTSYLSSTTTLMPDKSFKGKNYDESIICLSPPKKHMQYRIPYLKSLIGMEEVPSFNGSFDLYSYKHHGKNIKFKDRPLEVSKVLKQTYYSLLSHFIQDRVYDRLEKEGSEKGELNKIIFTIPNTFTPRHIRYLKEILSDDKAFGYFKKDYTTFLSESDAVACNYVYDWNGYNLERENTDQYNRGTEYTLVYDMGAGTLDLTYFKIDTDEKGKKEVSIIGKLGKATAGNYLDYAVAKAVYEDVIGRNPGIMAFNPMEIQNFKEAGIEMAATKIFKDVIRGEIKPYLDSTEDYHISLTRFEVDGEASFEITDDLQGSFNDIRGSKEVQDFIYENTKVLFDNFFGLFRGEQGVFYSKGEIPLDTVIFTGRSMQFLGLQNAVKEEIRAWAAEGDGLHFIDNLQANALKNIVVKGALQYALLYRDKDKSPVIFHNRNLQARYGVAFNDPQTGKWKYKNLLDPTTRPVKDSPVVKDGITIYEYDTDQYDADEGNHGRANYVDMSNTVKGWFVQSYAKDTAADMNAGNTEYITKIEAIRRDTLDGEYEHTRVRIRIDANNEMKLTVGEDDLDPTAPLRIDLENSETFKKSMWPYL